MNLFEEDLIADCTVSDDDGQPSDDLVDGLSPSQTRIPFQQQKIDHPLKLDCAPVVLEESYE
jgi:hypothetical protein